MPCRFGLVAVEDNAVVKVQSTKAAGSTGVAIAYPVVPAPAANADRVTGPTSNAGKVVPGEPAQWTVTVAVPHRSPTTGGPTGSAGGVCVQVAGRRVRAPLRPIGTAVFCSRTVVVRDWPGAMGVASAPSAPFLLMSAQFTDWPALASAHAGSSGVPPMTLDSLNPKESGPPVS